MTVLKGGEALLEIRGENVAHAQAVAADLVRISGTDAFQRGSDLAFTGGCFQGGIHQFMGGEDQMGLLGNNNFFAGVDAHFGYVAAFLAECHGIQYDTVADDVLAALAEDAGGDAPDYETLAIEMQGVPGIGTALETGDGRISSGQDIYNLTFSFIAPLEAENDINFCHIC